MQPPEMRWDRLITPERFFGAHERVVKDIVPDERSSYQKDFDRIIYCSAFRRLQDKTQVHPFPGTDYVRTRLTHSLEVTSVGRSLGVAVGRHVRESTKELFGPDGAGLSPNDFGDVTAAACLAHDIGNPPFGHGGEDAIRQWFREHGAQYLKHGIGPQETADLTHFEGNAQGFRVLSRIQGWRTGGLRLGCSTLAAFAKYPYGSLDITVENTAGERHGDGDEEHQRIDSKIRDKFGYFSADAEAFAKVAETTGLLRTPQKKGEWCRHPLSILVEAADDICYHIVDLEDGFKYKKISFDEASALLRPIAQLHGSLRYDDLPTHSDQIAYLRGWAIGALVRLVVSVFLEKYREIMRGTFTQPIVDCLGEATQSLKQINSLCAEQLYNDADKLETEVAGSEVIRGLLDLYCGAIEAWEAHNHNIEATPPLERRVLRLIPNFDLLPHDRYGWLLKVTDHISGMSDSYVVAKYRSLMGISVGHSRTGMFAGSVR